MWVCAPACVSVCICVTKYVYRVQAYNTLPCTNKYLQCSDSKNSACVYVYDFMYDIITCVRVFMCKSKKTIYSMFGQTATVCDQVT